LFLNPISMRNIVAWLYTVGIHLLGVFYRLAGLFHPKAKQWVRGRNQIQDFLSNPLLEGPVAWFHCASLGEFEQGRSLIEAFRESYPTYRILLTFFSPSGYEIRKNTPVADWVAYLPLDTPTQMRKFVHHVQPTCVFFVKYEFWPNLVQNLADRQIPMFAYSVILRPDQIYFRSGFEFFREALTSFTHLFVQNETSQNLLEGIGYHNHTLAGDTRFDRVSRIKEQGQIPEVLWDWKRNRQVWVLGSIWKEDWQLLRPFIQQHPDQLFIVAPHEWDATWQVESEVGLRWTDWDLTEIPTQQILWVDTMGQLSSLYRLADFAYIGGALGKGLHNTLEAAVFDIPIFFGNKRYQKFQEALDLLGAGAAWSVGSSDELSQQFHRLLDPLAYGSAQQGCRQVVQAGVGSTECIMNQLKHLISL
jgi:3-deoxy-D-manno-octulosonic-acid transferase